MQTVLEEELVASQKRCAELYAEIAALTVEIAAAKTRRNNKLAVMDAEIAALETEIVRRKQKTNPT